MAGWDVKQDDERKEDSVKTFIIFCEDENDEPFYFRQFQVPDKVKVNAIGNQKQKKLNLKNALKTCLNSGLVDVINGKYRIKEGITENIWCVYDRDLECVDIATIDKSNDIDFNIAVQTAIEAGIKVAWSNDAFELWILLHFESVPTDQKLHRNFVYNRLSDIFLKLAENDPTLGVLTSKTSYTYKNLLKRRGPFNTHVLPQLRDKTETAIKNAELIEAKYQQHVPFCDCNPCTKVHHLVKDLIEASKGTQQVK